MKVRFKRDTKGIKKVKLPSLKPKRSFKSPKHTAQSWEESFYNSENRTRGFVSTPTKAKKKVRTESKKPKSTMSEMADKLRGKTYKYFLRSKYWRIVREMVLKRDGNKCVRCNCKTSLQIHHKTYKNHFREHENLRDLETLCKTCHEKHHSKKD